MALVTDKIRGAISSGTQLVKTKVAQKGAPVVVKSATKEIINNLPKIPKLLAKLKQHDGEILNTLVTAVGTAFVAPVFIAFNPLSKEDKETKIYSAMRQPISAVIAVGAQLGIVSQFNKWVTNLAKSGRLDILKGLSTKEAAATLKSIQKYGGIAVTLATLPITCGILNWAYPRLMEKFMPNVANAKKNKCKEAAVPMAQNATAEPTPVAATGAKIKEAA